MQRASLLLAAALLASCQTQPGTSAATDRFTLADANKDGRLSREEVSDYLVHNVFDARDANGDGQLTAAEWTPDPADKASLAWFKQRDTNNDGVVSQSEAFAWGRKNQGWGEMMKEADSNNDGSISREEATAYLDSKEGPVR